MKHYTTLRKLKEKFRYQPELKKEFVDALSCNREEDTPISFETILRTEGLWLDSALTALIADLSPDRVFTGRKMSSDFIEHVVHIYDEQYDDKFVTTCLTAIRQYLFGTLSYSDLMKTTGDEDMRIKWLATATWSDSPEERNAAWVAYAACAAIMDPDDPHCHTVRYSIRRALVGDPAKMRAEHMWQFFTFLDYYGETTPLKHFEFVNRERMF